ncbi:MOSC domain-containing protein [Streptomyces albidoflavus]|uniref:MOSC domain-containing protein n=1 Tax=Streptomyces albidoflavus TaxID=1886 RepID=UPI0022524EB8|nr:MOSC N-terminal beta barrel domain-containing protein [Streptomyces albidoflavus]MCX4438835.1 MOSC domain-containing protein [Streptomyces albidoflavus]WTB79174.1 MOSC domain-containing protein [Streptomyces albidoflavus]
MPNAELTSLHVYPVKGTRGLTLPEATVEPWGLAGDRRWMLVDAEDRCITQRGFPTLALISVTPLPGGGLRLAVPGQDPWEVPVPGPGAPAATVEIWKDKVRAVVGDAAASADVSSFLGREVRLVHLADPARDRLVDQEFAAPGETVSFADGYPLLVTTTGSLDALNALIAEGDHAAEGPLPMERFRPNLVVSGTGAWDEDTWARVAVGEVTFKVAKMCGRCVVTTTDQRTAERGREPLRTLSRHRRFGSQLVFGQNLIPESTGTVRAGDPVTVLARRPVAAVSATAGTR